jgi:hypothetical protein
MKLKLLVKHSTSFCSLRIPTVLLFECTIFVKLVRLVRSDPSKALDRPLRWGRDVVRFSGSKGAWTILDPIGVAILVPSGPSGRNFLVFLSVQTSVLSCRKQFLLLISPVFVSLPGRSLDWGPWGSECLIGSIFATGHIRSGAPPAGRCLSI